MDEAIADFDVNVDRTTQIGVFAIAFASNIKVKTKVRNVLASLESLDSFLIPSLQANSNHDTNEIFGAHFNEEIQNFKKALEEIIDCPAFCRSYIAILQDFIDNFKDSNKPQLDEILYKGRIFHDQFKNNLENLKIEKEKYDKMLRMLEECEAISKCYFEVDKSKILKRLKVFKSTLKKIEVEFAVIEKKAKGEQAVVFMTSEELAESYIMFQSFGISPNHRSILYESRKRSDSMVGITSMATTNTASLVKDVKLKSSVKRRKFLTILKNKY